MIKKFDLIAFFAGLIAMLFVPTPFGRVAMFDLLSYFFAIIIIIGGYGKFNRTQKKLILFSLLWLLSTILTDLLRNEPQFVLLKSFLIVLSVPCLLIVSFFLLKRNNFSFLWFIVGYGISNVLSLYVFHNGSFLFYAMNPETRIFDITPYLIEKQYMPLYFGGVIYSILFPISVFYGIKYFILGLFFTIGAIFLLSVGSRLNFLTYGITALLSFIISLSNRIIKLLFNNIINLSVIGIITLIGIFQLYEYAAIEGLLGEAEKKKFEQQILHSEYGPLGGRETSVQSLLYAVMHPIIGTGSSRKNQEHPHLLVSGHSIIFGTWAINGLGGLIFWGYAVILLLRLLKKIYLVKKNWIPFVFFIISESLWHIFFSPFGLYRGFLCVVISFSAIQLFKLNGITNKNIKNFNQNEKIIISNTNKIK